MSEDNFAYGVITQSALCLDKIDFERDPWHTGPLVHIEYEGQTKTCNLPPDLRRLVLQRFWQANKPKGLYIGHMDVVLDPEDNPFETPPEPIPWVGIGLDDDVPGEIPITKYLPESKDDSVAERIVQYNTEVRR